jgi:cysteine synthase A
VQSALTPASVPAALAAQPVPHLACPAQRRLTSLSEAIGNTPMFAITYRFRGRTGTIHAKAEHLNLTGSIKDRMALHVLRTAYAAGLLHQGDTLAEATSGNAGIAFAALGRALGHRVSICMPDWMSQERRDLLGSYGADICLVSREDGGFLGSIRRTQEMAAAEHGVFLPRQFENAANVDAHRLGTTPELLAQLAAAGLVLDAFVAGVGTGGTVMGACRALRTHSPHTQVWAVEPAESPTMSTGHKVGSHRIQGISDEFIPAIVELRELDGILAVSDGDSILMARKLASTLGLGLGISSGCNFLAAITAAERLYEAGADAMVCVATVFPDDNKKYLSTSLLRDEPVRAGYITPEVELLDLHLLARPNLRA